MQVIQWCLVLIVCAIPLFCIESVPVTGTNLKIVPVWLFAPKVFVAPNTFVDGEGWNNVLLCWFCWVCPKSVFGWFCAKPKPAGLFCWPKALLVPNKPLVDGCWLFPNKVVPISYNFITPLNTDI